MATVYVMWVLVINNGLILQWYYINDFGTKYIELTLTVALNHLLFFNYGKGKNDNTLTDIGVSLTGNCDHFTGTKVNFSFIGGDGNNYIRHGFILILGC